MQQFGKPRVSGENKMKRRDGNGIVRIFRKSQIASNDVLEQSHTGVSGLKP